MTRQRIPRQSRAEEHTAYELVTLRDKGICQRCRRDCGPIARDHRQNRDGRNTVPSNLQCLGLTCHLWKTENPKAALAEGWSVPRHTTLTPAEWPARRWVATGRLAWVLYDDEGEWVEITDDEARERMEGRAA